LLEVAARGRPIGADRVLLDRAGEEDRALEFPGLRFHRGIIEAGNPDRRRDDAAWR